MFVDTFIARAFSVISSIDSNPTRALAVGNITMISIAIAGKLLIVLPQALS